MSLSNFRGSVGRALLKINMVEHLETFNRWNILESSSFGASSEVFLVEHYEPSTQYTKLCYIARESSIINQKSSPEVLDLKEQLEK